MTDIKMGYWVRFNAAGLPDWWGAAWIDGAEWIEGRTEDQLCTSRRVKGKWLPREPEPEVERAPDPEPEAPSLDAIKAELAALAERVAELQAAMDDAPKV